MAPGGVRVTTLKAPSAGSTAPGQPVLTYTGATRQVDVDLDVSDANLARNGEKVTVTLPDSKTTGGTVTDVGTVAHTQTTQGGTGQQNSSSSTATIKVTIRLDKPDEVKGLDAAPVSVDFISEEHKNVLTAPVASLLALREGGYGVEIVEGSTTRLVPVQTGLFANGRVEVKGPDISEGTTVAVPKS
jgi:hypothetical protein